MADFLFVYGTLLKGEHANHLLRDCILTGYTHTSGILYDTGFGFPALDYQTNSSSPVYGELYRLPRDNGKLIRELDLYEDTENGIFERAKVNIEGKESFIYQLKDPGIFNTRIEIESGSWLCYNSEIKEDPLSFALKFEQSHKFYYRRLSQDSNIFLPGSSGTVVSAPHSTNHVRFGRLKIFERYTAALSALLHSITGACSLYTNSVSISDPNYYDNCGFKETLSEIAKNKRYEFLLDIHGTEEKRDHDIYPGIGKNNEFLLGQTFILDKLYETAAEFGISCGSTERFPASKQQTVTKYGATRLNIPSMQLEINRKFRQPEKYPERFLSLVGFLREFLGKIKKE